MPAAQSPAAELECLLDRYPDAVVNAIDSRALLVPVPASIRLRGQHEFDGTSGVDLFSPADLPGLIALWEGATRDGVATGTLHFASSPDVPVTVHLLDVRAEHGVIVGLTHPLSGPEPAAPRRGSAGAPLRPRFGRMRRDGSGITLGVDEAAADLLGRPASELVGGRLLTLLHTEDRDLGARAWMAMLATPGLGRRTRLRVVHPDGRTVWLEVTNHNLLDDPEHGDVVSDLVDVSAEMAAVEEVRASEELLQRLAETVPVGLLQLDLQQRVVYVNAQLLDMVARPREQHAAEQLAAVSATDRPAVAAALAAVLGAGRESSTEISIQAGTEGERRCLLALRALRDGKGAVTGAIGCLSDITASVRLREELHVRATVDALTSCANRSAVLGHLDRVLADRTSAGTAAVFLDLDAFKVVNDEHGHAAGDVVLRVAAARLAAALSPGQLLGRLGGDEFLVVCSDVPDPAAAHAHAERLRLAAAGTVTLPDGHEVPLRASVGVSWAQVTTPDLLIDQADAAMYRAKVLSSASVLYRPGDQPHRHRARVRRRAQPPEQAS